MNEKNNTSKYIFRTLSIIVFSLVFCFLLTSLIFARFLSSDGNAHSARVAKWNIDFGNGTSYNSIISSTHLESGSEGEWGLDISNKSEVFAKFSKDSSVRIRLQSPDFQVGTDYSSWDFLLDNKKNAIDNPINFKAYMYSCSLAELETLNGDLSSIEVVEIFDTKNNSDVLEFEMVVYDGRIYMECIVNFGERLNAIEDFLLPIGTGQACMKIFWEVDRIADVGGAVHSFKSYFLVPANQYSDTKYKGKLDQGITINSVNYVIAYKYYDYFEYLLYTSSLGGEIMITFTDTLGKDYSRRCTKLSDAEKTILFDRKLNSTLTLEEANRYVELLEYQEFEKFLEIKSDYSKTTGYFSLGLECRLVLDLKVEQVD